jgi:hypothetical protein
MKYIVFTLLILAAGVGCKKRVPDAPPIQEIPVGNILTVQELRDLFQGSPVKFTDDYSVYATVTMDDRSGNIYRNAYIEDQSNGIVLRTNFPGGLKQGDSVRVALKGTVLGSFNGLLQLDSVDVDKNIIKQANNRPFTPANVTIEDIILNNYQSRLVRLTGVEFVGSDLGQTYANAVTQQSQNRTLTDCDGNTIIVRTSGFADFAGDVVAEGNGSIVCIANEFNGVKQLLIRNIAEVNMEDTRCTGGGTSGNAYLSKDFSDHSLTSGGWQSYVVLSSPNPHNWAVQDLGSAGNYYAFISGWNGSSADNTNIWLISPAVDLSAATAPGLSFRTSKNFNGPNLQVLISTDYDGISDPTLQGTWNNYTSFFTYSTGSYTWTSSGVVPMTAFNGQSSVYVAFQYTSGAGGAATWQVDDILIDEN